MNKILKTIVLSHLVFFCIAGQAFSFLFELEPMTKVQIQQLKDEKLIDTYIDVMIELEAVDKFFSNSGMKPKEYKAYTQLLRYRTDLIIELEKRELEIPRIQ